MTREHKVSKNSLWFNCEFHWSWIIRQIIVFLKSIWYCNLIRFLHRAIAVECYKFSVVLCLTLVTWVLVSSTTSIVLLTNIIDFIQTVWRIARTLCYAGLRSQTYIATSQLRVVVSWVLQSSADIIALPDYQCLSIPRFCTTRWHILNGHCFFLWLSGFYINLQEQLKLLFLC